MAASDDGSISPQRDTGDWEDGLWMDTSLPFPIGSIPTAVAASEIAGAASGTASETAGAAAGAASGTASETAGAASCVEIRPARDVHKWMKRDKAAEQRRQKTYEEQDRRDRENLRSSAAGRMASMIGRDICDIEHQRLYGKRQKGQPERTRDRSCGALHSAGTAHEVQRCQHG